MRKLILIIISAVSLLGTPAFAKDSGSSAWIVSQLSGDARVVHPGLQPVALKTAARLEPGDRIVTGLTGRATLTREADYIIVAPHSDLQLPVTAEPKGFTRVIQNLGTMLFKVRHTGIPHFTVDTPMLAAVVKGTTFTVVVGPDRSAVQVIEGAVQVTAADGGMSRLVEGGKTVFIDRLEPKRLMDADERSPATTASSSTTAVKLVGSQTPSVATIAGLTEGLVQAGSTNSTAAATTTTPAAPLPDPSSTVANTTQPAVNIVDSTGSDTLTNVVDTTAPGVADTVTNVVDSTVPGVTDTVTNVVDTVVPGVTDTVTNVVDSTVPGVTDTVTNIVDTVVPGVTDTVTNVVDTTVPSVTDTVTDVVDTVTDVVEVTVPGVTDPVTDVVGGVTDTVTDVVGGLLGGSGGSSGSGSSGSSGSGGGLLGGNLGGLIPH
jgi:hypothetical protein